jgi:hypothetical protein
LVLDVARDVRSTFPGISNLENVCLYSIEIIYH